MIELLHFTHVYEFLQLNDLLKMTLVAREFNFIREHPWSHLTIKCHSYQKFFNFIKYYNFKNFYVKQKKEDKKLNKICWKYDKLDIDTKKYLS